MEGTNTTDEKPNKSDAGSSTFSFSKSLEKCNKKRKYLSSDSQKSELLISKNNLDDDDLEGYSSGLRYNSNKKISNSVDEIPEVTSSKKRKIIQDKIEVDITAPDPPSKKELRLLKKGKPLPSHKSSVESTGTKNMRSKESETDKRSNYGVWIGNLPYRVLTDEIRRFLVNNSRITDEMITRIHMPRPRQVKTTQKAGNKSGQQIPSNKGFAYIDFSCAEAIVFAVELSEKLLSGRRLLIKDSKSFEGRPVKVKDELLINDKLRTKRVFLGNLSFDTTEEILREHFEKCGPIKTLKIATFEDSGKCKGFAWIVFEEFEAAKSAVRGFINVTDPVIGPDFEITPEDNSSKISSFNSKGKESQRKVWVNKFKGRILRVEFAEDAQLRYKKRYGKDSMKHNADRFEVTQERSNFNPVKSEVKIKYRQQYAPRLTGGIVESKGKKITF